MAIKRILVVLALLLVARQARQVRADEPSDADQKKAKAHYKQGRAFQDAGLYDQAIDEYQQGFALVPLPAFLFNIGQAYRLKDDKQQALDYYKQYLDAEPDGPGADEASQHIAELTKAISDEEAAKKAQEEQAKPPPVEEKKPPPVEEKPEPTPAEPPPLEHPDKPHPGRTFEIMGVGAMVAGALGVTMGVVFGLKAESLASDVETKSSTATTWTPELQSMVDDGHAAESQAVVFDVVGALCLISGGTLFYVGLQQNHAASAETLSLVPSLTPSSRGVALVGSF